MESVKRTTINSVDLGATIPAVRFTDYDPSAPHPSSELLGYFHSSATRTGFLYKALRSDHRLLSCSIPGCEREGLTEMSALPFFLLLTDADQHQTSLRVRL